MKNGDIPAAPDEYTGTSGLTKREHFAGLAMQGLLSGTGYHPLTSSNIMALSAMSVQTADAVLRKLEEG